MRAVVKVLHVLALAWLLVSGCAMDDSCRCDDIPCIDYQQFKTTELVLKCSCFEPYCCDTCDGDEECLELCVDRDE